MFLFNKTSLYLALLSSTLIVSACSKHEQKPTDTVITATDPIRGEASTLIERNTEKRFRENLQNNFKKAGINATITGVRGTELPNMYWVSLDGFPAVLASSDGKYIFQGDVIRLGDKQIHHVSEALQAKDNQAKFARLKLDDLIIYPATAAKTKHIIYVFTDVHCPYCQKFHSHMQELNQKGVEVRYIAWPRGEQFFPTMESVWCSEDRKAALEQAFHGIEIQAPQCNSPVMAQYQLGMNIGVNGTPAVYSQDGRYLSGYIEPSELLKKLDEP